MCCISMLAIALQDTADGPGKKIGSKACRNSVAKKEEAARMENDKVKTGQTKEERHNNEMARDLTQWDCVAGQIGVVFVQTNVSS